ncbi:MAG: hypothetical protein ACO3GK_03380 [Bacteroidia bacterium]
MKNTLLATLAIALLFGCKKEAAPLSMEGKWLWSPTANKSGANTMYEFRDGVRYTYYCDEPGGCDAAYWNSLTQADALPATETYQFKNDTLSMNLGFGNSLITPVTFSCEGAKATFESNGPVLYNLNLDCP